MTKQVLAVAVAFLTAALGPLAPASAHHSFAMFNLTEHKLIEGVVTEWNYNNPHSWLHIQGLDENGETKTWSFEGAAMVHAARQGVNGTTFRKGERVKVVMSPLRDGRTAGAMCFVVKEDGALARPNDGVCNSVEVIETWQSNGWIEKGKHLDAHPSGR